MILHAKYQKFPNVIYLQEFRYFSATLHLHVDKNHHFLLHFDQNIDDQSPIFFDLSQ